MIRSILTRRDLLAAAIATSLVPTFASAQTRKLRVGVLRLSSSGAVFLAQDMSFFNEAGLDVELVFFGAAQPIAVAAASGDIDIGVTAFTAGLYNLAGKGALSVIAGQSREVPGFPLDAFLATTKPNGDALKKPQDIRGKRIGITQIGSSFHFVSGLVAEKYKFPLSEVTFVPLQSMGNIVSALQGGAVDGAVLPATVASGAVASGAARLIGWGSDEAPWQIGAAFASAKIKADEATIGKFLTAYKRACKLFHDKLDAKGVAEAERAPLLEIIARYTNQKPEAVAKTLAFVEPDAKLDLPNVAHQIEWYQAHGFVDKGFGLEQVIDRRFVKN